MNGTRLRAIALCVVAIALARPGLAQPPTLDRVDSLLTAGAYADARATLDRWWAAPDELPAPGADNARALMLRARLATDPADAESDYLALVLGYPTSDYAPAALLRLGQGLLATGDYARSIGYLQRLTTDYPGRPERTRGLLWLARAATAARRPALACRSARAGLADATDSDLAAMLRIQAAASCTIGGDPGGGQPS